MEMIEPKHAKKAQANFDWAPVKLSYEPPRDEFYKARIQKLETENAELKNTVKALEKEVARMDRVYDRTADRIDDVIAEKDELIAKLKDAIIREVIR